MSRIPDADRSKVAEAYELAAVITAGYIRAGIKVQTAAADQQFDREIRSQSWGQFITALAAKIVNIGSAEVLARARR